MPHKPWKLLLSVWTTSLALVFTLAAGSNAQETLQPYAPPILHPFLDSANVYPESVTVDQSSGTFFVGSVKEGTIYKGKIARPSLEVFSPGGTDGRSIATGMFFANNRLVVVGRQTGLVFVYNTKNGRLISKLDNGLRTGQTFLNDTTFAPDGSAYVTDSVNPVLYRVAPTRTGQYVLQEFLKFEGTPVTYVNAPGAAGINVNGIVATSDGRYLIIGKRNENRLFRIDLKSREIVPLNMPPIVTTIPLENIWTDEEQVAASRERYLTSTDLTEMLRLHPVEFIVADVGAPLKRISVDKCYEFWEREVKRHLLSPHGKVDRSNMADEYGYLASEWSGHIEVPIVLLEKIH